MSRLELGLRLGLNQTFGLRVKFTDRLKAWVWGFVDVVTMVGTRVRVRILVQVSSYYYGHKCYLSSFSLLSDKGSSSFALVLPFFSSSSMHSKGSGGCTRSNSSVRNGKGLELGSGARVGCKGWDPVCVLGFGSRLRKGFRLSYNDAINEECWLELACKLSFLNRKGRFALYM